MRFRLFAFIIVLFFSPALFADFTQIHHTKIGFDNETQRLITTHEQSQLSLHEQACLQAQSSVIQNNDVSLPNNIQISYEIVSSNSKRLDDQKLLKDRTVMGPFQGLIHYPGMSKSEYVFHIPVLVYSDGQCEISKSAWIQNELKQVIQAKASKNSVQRKISKRVLASP